MMPFDSGNFRHVFGYACTLAFFTLSCASGEKPSDREAIGVDSARVRIELDQSNERNLLAFYIGGMVSEGGGDPFAAQWVSEKGRAFYLNIDSIAVRLPEFADELRDVSSDGLIDWDELEPLIGSYYYRYRSIAGSIEELRGQIGDWTDDSEWFGLRVDGVMSPHTRQIRVRISSLVAALEAYRSRGERIIYPIGTTFVSEQVQDGRIVESAVMTKRPDGYWDFSAYGAGGDLITIVERDPSDLLVPTRCIGCHFGNRLFEPERSFPAASAPGPDGPRVLYTNEPFADGDLVLSIDEHRKRSDTVLGLYATLFISQARTDRREGTLPPDVTSAMANAGF